MTTNTTHRCGNDSSASAAAASNAKYLTQSTPSTDTCKTIRIESVQEQPTQQGDVKNHKPHCDQSKFAQWEQRQ
jgi:DNA-directed RNA polymerase subunit M/transcription elongation factor TFIIS